jgi:hypothetical protein
MSERGDVVTLAQHARGGRPRRPLPLTYFDDAHDFPPKDWLIKGVIARRETSTWAGGPGKGKSALLTSLCIHVASGTDWRGYRSKGRAGAVYFAFERADLVRRRLAAHARRERLSGLPIAVADQLVNLMDKTCVPLIVDTIEAASEAFGIEVGFAVFDTFAKGIAAGGGDEDKAKDVGNVLANLRRIQAATGVHVAVVSHTGKDEGRGVRGSNAHIGDVDTSVQIKGDDIKTAEVTKANDQPEGTLTRFRLETFELGHDDDGDPITTAIISSAIIESPETADASRPLPKLTDDQKNAVRALHEVISGRPMPIPPSFGLPTSVTKAARLDDWRQEMFRAGVLDKEAANPREDFRRIKARLQALGIIGLRDDLVWSAR